MKSWAELRAQCVVKSSPRWIAGEVIQRKEGGRWMVFASDWRQEKGALTGWWYWLIAHPEDSSPYSRCYTHESGLCDAASAADDLPRVVNSSPRFTTLHHASPR